MLTSWPLLLRNRGPIACEGRFDDSFNVLLEQVALRRQPQCRRADLGRVVLLVPIPLGKGSARITLAARVLSSGAKNSVSPFIGTICSGEPVTGSRGFQPVCVPTGTVMSGRRTPAVSLPSASTAETIAG
jgi:hypothetical protein